MTTATLERTQTAFRSAYPTCAKTFRAAEDDTPLLNLIGYNATTRQIGLWSVAPRGVVSKFAYRSLYFSAARDLIDGLDDDDSVSITAEPNGIVRFKTEDGTSLLFSLACVVTGCDGKVPANKL